MMKNEMSALDIARRMAELDRREDACKAYTLALADGPDPETELEAALYILQEGGNYKVAYDSFLRLYNEGQFREEILSILTQAFYEPNQKLLRSRYEKNCKLLQKYPYLFQKEFPAFNELPIRFFPYDDRCYVPFYVREERFGESINFNYPVISRNFFRDLENPVLAEDVFSQYEMEYLNDNVRKSEWVGRENHIYLHYRDWEIFCAHLQVLNLRRLLEGKKFVFLIGNEVEQYPIDFKERFGIDYSQCPVKPLGIREVNRLIWHTQLAAHNGGDFFNEIFDNHPNLIMVPSIMMNNVEETVEGIKTFLREGGTFGGIVPADGDEKKVYRLLDELRQLKNRTDKDIFVTFFLWIADLRPLDPAARIVPAIFFQPHFSNIYYSLATNRNDRALLDSDEYRAICNSPLFRGFKYIKTFTPMRRITTSYAATVRFMYAQTKKPREDGTIGVVSDVLVERLLNRSFMVDWQERLFKDSVLVRFEDGKLNPRATFTALAAFLDLPYTESMTYCSDKGKHDPVVAGNVLGFDPATVYRTYDEYAGDDERYLLEYFMRDAYEYYGYGFQYYDGKPMDLERAKEMIDGFTVLDQYIRETWRKVFDTRESSASSSDENADFEEILNQKLEEKMRGIREKRYKVAEILLRGLRFLNKNGQPLNMMPRLQLDPALLEQPLYH